MTRTGALWAVSLTLTLACSVDSGEGMTSLSGSSPSTGFTSADASSTASESGDSMATSSSDDTQGTSDPSTGDGDGDGDASSSGDGDGDGDGDTSGTTTSTSGGTTTTGGSGDPLDPDLDVPPESNTPCDTPGSLNECPSGQVCRFYDTLEGRCESCSACGNLNAFCSDGTDCDILFMCYQNTCTNFCTLGTYECGAIDQCVNIGHPTKGVCAP